MRNSEPSNLQRLEARRAVEYIAIDRLKPSPTNPRTHSKKQLRQLAKAIETFGFTNPIIVSEDTTILAGHGRLEAAKTLGLAEIPCIRLSHMSPAECRAYVIADNRLAELAGWDDDLLTLELGFLLESDFDLDVTGFSISEVDALVDGTAPKEDGDPADDQIPQHVPARCQPGQIWRLGTHRLICGDALDPAVICALMGGEKAAMIFTDPPYNVPIDGHVSGNGSIQHRDFAQASGEMSREEFTNFLRKAFANLIAHSDDGSIHFIFMDWRHMQEIQEAANGLYSELKNLIVWAKDAGGMGTFYRSRHELIFAFKNGTAAHYNAFELGQHGRYRTNVWQYRGVNSFGPERMADLRRHPTSKPVQLIVDAIKDVSPRNGIVLDPFAGSGSTLIACHRTGRLGRLCEIDPHLLRPDHQAMGRHCK